MINSKKLFIAAIVVMAMATAFVLYGTIMAKRHHATNKYPDNCYIEYSADDYCAPSGSAVPVIMSERGIECESEAVTVIDGDIYILAAGSYILSGTWDKGSIIISVEGESAVTLYLANVGISAPEYAAICVKDAKKVILSTLPDTENTLSDAAEYSSRSDIQSDVDAAVYSTGDLTLNGLGALTVSGNFGDGIKSTKKLRIMSGDISVTAVDDGISGKSAVGIRGGNITVYAGGDGIKTESEESENGFIAMEGGTFKITAGGDGIAAKRYVFMNGDCIADITSGGGADAEPPTDSAKGIKAGIGIYAENGQYTVNANDDAVHSDGTITVNGGSLDIQTGDDGIHAAGEIKINGGTVLIGRCYEGVESDEYLEINGGSFDIISDDDGISVGAATKGPPRNMGEIQTEMPLYIAINGGSLTISTAEGDGIDSNGDIEINGGEVTVYGSGRETESAVDFDGSLYINGGTLLTVGSSGMNEFPSESSAQPVIWCYADPIEAGSRIELCHGEAVMYTIEAKQTSNLVFASSSELKQGEEYTVYVNGTELATVKIDGILNKSGESTSAMTMPPGRQGGERPQPPNGERPDGERRGKQKKSN